MKKIVLLLTLLTFFQQNLTMAAQTTLKTPAAWVWRVSSENRHLYLVGELHVFVGLDESQVSFELGDRIFSGTSIAYTEANELKISPVPVLKTLSELLGPHIWQRVQVKMKAVVNQTNISDEKKEGILEDLLKEMNDQSPIIADATLRNFSTLMYVKELIEKKETKKIVFGLSSRLKKSNTNGSKNAKLAPIESDFLIDEVWRRSCDSREKAQQLIVEALNAFEFDTFWRTNKVAELQNLFRDSYFSVDSGKAFMDYWLTNYPASEIFMTCNILPRNILWEEKIINILKTKGEPVSVFVGIAHLIGEHGLISSLQKNSSYKIERVYSFQDASK